MHNENEPLPVITSPPTMKRMLVIGKGQELHQVSLSPTLKSTTTGEDTRGLGNNAISKALNQISKSPFMHKIERVKLPRRFHQPTLTMYNSRTDPVEYVIQFNQRMAIHSKDEALMCKVFPFSLGPVAMRWFDSLRTNSIDSFKELT